MNEFQKGYPQPIETIDNAPYLQGWRSGRLLLQYCDSCQCHIFYPRVMCPHCWNDRLIWKEATGKGKVVSYSLIHRPNHPAFNDEVPIALAEIELDEGVSMLARVLQSAPHTGMRVQLFNDAETTGRYPLPVFKPMA